MTLPFLSITLALPILGAAMQALVAGPRAGRWVALLSSGASSALAVALVATMQPAMTGLQHVESHPWLASFSIAYLLGLDGLNAIAFLLVALLFPALVIAEWRRTEGARGFFALLLLEQTALLGATCAQDLFVLLLFWSFAALPIYFLVGVWGGRDREAASVRYLVSAVVGNAIFFCALILIYHSADPKTLSIAALGGDVFGAARSELLGHSFATGSLAVALIALGVALRIPVWPLQGWFSRVLEQSPASVMAVLAGGVVPVGFSIFSRLTYTLFPTVLLEASALTILVGVACLVMGAIGALGYRTLPRLLAQIVMVLVGWMVLGVGSLSLSGASGALILQVSLGLGAALFALLIAQLQAQGGVGVYPDAEELDQIRGLAWQSPALGVLVAITIVALVGLPSAGGFVGQALIALGAYPGQSTAVVVAGFAYVLIAWTLLGFYRRFFLGPSAAMAGASVPTSLDRLSLLPWVGVLLAVGLYPRPWIELIRPTLTLVLSTVR